LLLFFKTHDPTTLNRQGADKGSQYRSIIIYKDNEQKFAAENTIKSISDAKIYSDPIVTEIIKLEKFYPAEDHHQDFYAKNPAYGYCSVVINPKLAKLDELLTKK